MPDTPSYLAMLNGIAVSEESTRRFFDTWRAATTHPGVRATLETVVIREGEHSLAFAKRINELGYTVEWKDDAEGTGGLDIAGSDMPDLEKFETLGINRYDNEASPDIFVSFLHDNSIDSQTGALLGRYIAEERDSARMLKACYDQLCAEAGRPPQGSASTDDDRVAALDAKIDTVCSAVEELRDMLTAHVASSNCNGNGADRLATSST